MTSLSPAMKQALGAAFDDGEGGHVLWFDTNKHVAYALNRRRLVDDFFKLTGAGERARCAQTEVPNE